MRAAGRSARSLLAGSGLAALAACGLFRPKPPVPVANPHFVVGDPYHLGGVWLYPRIQFTYEDTGLAAVDDDKHPALTTDGEVFDQTILAASHRTLQLPAIARVTNLDTGLSVLVRINDRGPAPPARLISLTSRAAALLQVKDGSRVRVQVQEGPSRGLAAALGGDGPKLALAAAPAGPVTSETLAPPPGAAASSRVRQAPAAAREGPEPNDAPVSDIPLRLPEELTQGPATGGEMYIDCGSFSRAEYARLLLQRLSGLDARIVTSYDAPRDRAYSVRIGPLVSVPIADAMLDRTITAE